MWYITCPVCTVLLVNLLCQLCVVKRAIMSDTSIGLHSQSIQPVDCMYHVWGPWGGFCPVPCALPCATCGSHGEDPALCHAWELCALGRQWEAVMGAADSISMGRQWC